MRSSNLFFLWIIAHISAAAAAVVEDADFWMDAGRLSIEEALKVTRNEGIAKNTILFIGDGMGLPTITAGRIFKGQLEGRSGEEGYLTFEKFENVGLLKTYNVDRQVPDSAGTATALFSGVKANWYTLGFDATVTAKICRPEVEAKAKVKNILDWAIAAGKATGIVTTTRITHATPAAAFAHSAHRDWECDTEIPVSEQNGCKDIARQLIEEEPGRSIDVIMGGGEQTLTTVKVNGSNICTRGDGRNLIFEWMKWQKNQGKQYIYVKTKEQMLQVDDDSIDRLLGVFSVDHIPYDKERNLNSDGHPSLEEMTGKAIKILSKNKNGFLLIVEGGRIDHAHHDNYAKIALEEVVAFDKAVAKALSMTKRKDTLVVVTADHSHSMSINGYPNRGNPIEGLSFDATQEGFPYETLSYINGPGYNYHRLNESEVGEHNSSTWNTWRNLNLTFATNNDRYTPHFAGYYAKYETHGGEDVAVYASGPMGHLFHGVHEQTHVAFSIAYSACIGPYSNNCRVNQRVVGKPPRVNSTSTRNYFSSVLLLILPWLLLLRPASQS